MDKISKVLEKPNLELNMQLHGESYADPCVHVAADSLKKTGIQFFWKKLKLNFLAKHWARIAQYYYTEQMSKVVSG